MLRTDAGLTLAEVARRRGVTKAAARQAENRDYDAMKVGSLIDQIRAIGYDVDAGWLVQALANHLPVRPLHTSDAPSSIGGEGFSIYRSETHWPGAYILLLSA